MRPTRQPRKAPENIAPIGYEPRDLFDKSEVVLFDETDPKSVVNLLDEKTKAAVRAIPAEFWKLSEKKLREKVNPDELTCRLRITFWDEYQAAQDDNRGISVANVMRGVTYAEYFYQHVLPDPGKMAWILTPPSDFLLALRDLLYVGLDKLREILSLPIVETIDIRDKKTGEVIGTEKRVNMALAREIRAITEKLADRVHGAVIQKLAVKQESLHVHASADPFTNFPIDQLQALDQQLGSINQKLELAAPGSARPQTLDIESTDAYEILSEAPDRSDGT